MLSISEATEPGLHVAEKAVTTHQSTTTPADQTGCYLRILAYLGDRPGKSVLDSRRADLPVLAERTATPPYLAAAAIEALTVIVTGNSVRILPPNPRTHRHNRRRPALLSPYLLQRSPDRAWPAGRL